MGAIVIFFVVIFLFVIFLVWIWISNLAILLGAEFNAEIERARAETDGLPKGAEPSAIYGR